MTKPTFHKPIIKSTDARETAVYVLNQLNSSSKTLDYILDNLHEKNLKLSKRDLSLFYTLVYGVLRFRARLDWIITHFSKTKLKKIKPSVLNILRIGLFQIIYLDRVPVSAAVNTCVQIAKSNEATWIAAYVNGVLRNAARDFQKVIFPCIQKDPGLAIATNKSFPKWLIKDWIDLFGQEQTENLCDAINTIPVITIRTNSLKTNREKLIEAISDHVENIHNTSFVPHGISFSNPKIPINEIKGFKQGWFQVQDQGAQLVSIALNPKPGETVLDACAGLGGKTGHIAQLMNNQGTIVAIDKSETKLTKLKAEMNRLGIKIVSPVTWDLNYPLSDNSKKFDRVLLDAPCSGLGVLRRNPDAKWSTSKESVDLCAKTQIRFMDNLASVIKPSGLLVYSVCSFQTQENEDVIKVFLNKHREFAIQEPDMPIRAKSFVTRNNYIKTFPDIKTNMDGFFIVVLKKVM